MRQTGTAHSIHFTDTPSIFSSIRDANTSSLKPHFPLLPPGEEPIIIVTSCGGIVNENAPIFGTSLGYTPC